MQVQLITPEKILFSGAATMVIVPGVEGDFGVLQGHAPFISVIRPGVITIETDSGKRKMAVAGGIAEAVPERCTILAEHAVDCENMTRASVEGLLAEAKRVHAEAETDKARDTAAMHISMFEALINTFAAH